MGAKVGVGMIVGFTLGVAVTLLSGAGVSLAGTSVIGSSMGASLGAASVGSTSGDGVVSAAGALVSFGADVVCAGAFVVVVAPGEGALVVVVVVGMTGALVVVIGGAVVVVGAFVVVVGAFVVGLGSTTQEHKSPLAGTLDPLMSNQCT